MKVKQTPRIPSYITRCKSPKKLEKVKKIVDHIIIGVRKGYDAAYLAHRLNKYKILTLMDKLWTPNSVQMQLLKIHRNEQGSSLADYWHDEYKHGRVYDSDLALIAERVRTA